MLREQGDRRVDGGHGAQKTHHATRDDRNRLNLHLPSPED
jgi:hypothetical protein